MSRKLTLFGLILVSLAMLCAEPERDTQLFDRAKLLLFDKKWDSALENLDTLIEKFPQSQYYNLAVFYRAKCFEEKKNRQEALQNYTKYLKLSANRSLMEEAKIAIIDLCFQLFEGGEHKYIENIKRMLKADESAVRYYAAFKLSYVKDKRIARVAVPVLKRLIANESDEELIDRAKIGLMRIDRSLLKELEGQRKIEAAYLKIRIYNKKSKKDTFSINLPMALAKLALEAIPDKEKQVMDSAGVKINNLLNDLIKSRDVIKIEGEEELIQIWIE